MAKFTVHAVVRNEPFIYYSIKSVYDFADLIFLYDTGSYDAHTLEDIQTLLAEDKAGKIRFKKVPIDVDETIWTMDTIKALRARYRGKKVVGDVRLQQLRETKTPYFMVLDGDEVHYRATMIYIRTLFNKWPSGKICGFIPLIWFCDPGHVFWDGDTGRLFLTDGVGMKVVPLGEMATDKRSGKAISRGASCSFRAATPMPCTHWETFLKPWRRPVHPSKVRKYGQPLPEVMVKDDRYLRRFLKEGPRKCVAPKI